MTKVRNRNPLRHGDAVVDPDGCEGVVLVQGHLACVQWLDDGAYSDAIDPVGWVTEFGVPLRLHDKRPSAAIGANNVQRAREHLQSFLAQETP